MLPTGYRWLWHWSSSYGESKRLRYFTSSFTIKPYLQSDIITLFGVSEFKLFIYFTWQGNRAIAEIQFADYIFPAFDQAFSSPMA